MAMHLAGERRSKNHGLVPPPSPTSGLRPAGKYGLVGVSELVRSSRQTFMGDVIGACAVDANKNGDAMRPLPRFVDILMSCEVIRSFL